MPLGSTTSCCAFWKVPILYPWTSNFSPSRTRRVVPFPCSSFTVNDHKLSHFLLVQSGTQDGSRPDSSPRAHTRTTGYPAADPAKRSCSPHPTSAFLVY